MVDQKATQSDFKPHPAPHQGQGGSYQCQVQVSLITTASSKAESSENLTPYFRVVFLHCVLHQYGTDVFQFFLAFLTS